MPLLTLLLINAAVSAVAFIGLWLVGLRLKDVSFIDAWWGLGMALIAWSTLVQVGVAPHGALLTGLCSLWAARLGGYLFWRWRKQGPDHRYVTMMDHAKTVRGWSFAKASLLIVFSLQYLLQFVVALPVQLGQFGASPLGPLAIAGAGLAVIGIGFESLGD